MQDASDHRADKIFLVVPVQKQPDRHAYTKGDWLRRTRRSGHQHAVGRVGLQPR